jgi:hypothetical protein
MLPDCPRSGRWRSSLERDPPPVGSDRPKQTALCPLSKRHPKFSCRTFMVESLGRHLRCCKQCKSKRWNGIVRTVETRVKCCECGAAHRPAYNCIQKAAVPVHSSRSRIKGSTEMARCAGTHVATRPTSAMARTTPASTSGSRGVAW